MPRSCFFFNSGSPSSPGAASSRSMTSGEGAADDCTIAALSIQRALETEGKETDKRDNMICTQSHGITFTD